MNEAVETDEGDAEYRNAILSEMEEETQSFWHYMLSEYDVPDELLVSVVLSVAFDHAIQECGSGLGAVVGFQRAIAQLALNSSAREMALFKMRVN